MIYIYIFYTYIEIFRYTYHMIYSIHESLEMLLSVTHRIRCGGGDLCLEAAGGPTSPTYFEEGKQGQKEKDT